MSNIKTVVATLAQRQDLEAGSKYGSTPSFRLRCRAILLKCEERTSLSVSQELDCCEVSVNDWMKRFAAHGVAGLKVAQGRGRKSILQTEADYAAVRRAVQKNRQRIGLAKEELEKELGKEFSQITLRRFLKKTIAASSVFDGSRSANLPPTFTK